VDEPPKPIPLRRLTGMPRIRAGLAILILAAPALVGCGSGSDASSTKPNSDLKSADEMQATKTSEDLRTVKIGEFAEVKDFGRVAVTSVKVGGDDLGPWLEAEVRFENTSGEDSSATDTNLVCAGDGANEFGGYQADSTFDPNQTIPDKSFSEGTLNLLPVGFKRTGEAESPCATPAFIRFTPFVHEEGTELSQVAVPDDAIDELNSSLPK
jgi:hypothetical protein